MFVEVVLRESVKKLGKIGQVVRVRSGYARNFLLPQQKAMRASPENLKIFENQRAELEALNLKKLEDAKELAMALEGYMLTLVRQAGEGGQLYGSITAKDIESAFQAQKIAVRKEHVVLATPLKTLGVHVLKLALHPEITTSISLVVAKTQEEADIAKQKLLNSQGSKAALEAELAGEEA